MIKGAGFGEADHRAFGGNIGVGVRNTVQARDGTLVHNRAAVLFLHLRDFVLHAVIHSQDIDFQHLFEYFAVRLRQQSYFQRYCSIVHRIIKRA